MYNYTRSWERRNAINPVCLEYFAYKDIQRKLIGGFLCDAANIRFKFCMLKDVQEMVLITLSIKHLIIDT